MKMSLVGTVKILKTKQDGEKALTMKAKLQFFVVFT